MSKHKKQTDLTRSRRPSATVNESFRRNNVVVSKSQREVAQRQQSVTQRQLDLKRSLTRKRARNKFIAVTAAALLILLFFRMSADSVSLDSNASSRLKAEQTTTYKAAVLEGYRANTLFGQTWLLDNKAFSKDITDKYPEVEHVDITTLAPLKRDIQADIRFRKPVFIWRDASQTDQFVDKNGVLFSKNLDPSVNVKKLIRIEDQSGVVLEEGSSVLTEQLIQFVGQLHSKVPQLYGAGNSITRVIIPRSTREVQIQVSNQPYLIKLSSVRNIDEEVGELRDLLAFLKQGNITPAAYIDVRVPHKAFYK